MPTPVTFQPMIRPVICELRDQILGAWDIQITRRGRPVLMAVTRNQSHLRNLQRAIRIQSGFQPEPLGRCDGAVVSPDVHSTYTREDGTTYQRITRDQHYVCAIFFWAKKLCPALVAHEAVHAAIAWAEQTTYRFDPDPEEQLAYATGAFVEAITKALQGGGLL